MPIVVPRSIPSKSPSIPSKPTLTEEKLKAIFKQYDTNRDGRLNKAELKEAFKHLGALIPGWRVNRALYHADANGDGCISEEEMQDLVKYAAKFGYTIY